MSQDAISGDLDFNAAADAAEDGAGLIIDIDGYEGPLHLLLALARSQKVDLLKLSVLKLAEQYLAFVHGARTRRFALAADYLVMAAWLAFCCPSPNGLPRTRTRLRTPRPNWPSSWPGSTPSGGRPKR
jgi:segregation and condensation protein A